MSVRIYSRLGDVLRHRGVSVIELRTSVADRFGIAADRRTLARWARPSRVRRLDLELAWAIASVLGVPLEEVFTAEEPTDDGSRPTTGAVRAPTPRTALSIPRGNAACANSIAFRATVDSVTLSERR